MSPPNGLAVSRRPWIATRSMERSGVWPCMRMSRTKLTFNSKRNRGKRWALLASLTYSARVVYRRPVSTNPTSFQCGVDHSCFDLNANCIGSYLCSIYRKCLIYLCALSQDVEKGLRDGTLLKGKLRINARRRSTAFVTADGGVLLSDIFLESEKARNRAQEGDLVGFFMFALARSTCAALRYRSGVPHMYRCHMWSSGDNFVLLNKSPTEIRRNLVWYFSIPFLLIFVLWPLPYWHSSPLTPFRENPNSLPSYGHFESGTHVSRV